MVFHVRPGSLGWEVPCVVRVGIAFLMWGQMGTGIFSVPHFAINYSYMYVLTNYG